MSTAIKPAARYEYVIRYSVEICAIADDLGEAEDIAWHKLTKIVNTGDKQDEVDVRVIGKFLNQPEGMDD